MRSNFLKQKTAEVGLTENKENVPQVSSNIDKEDEDSKKEKAEPEKDYHTEEWIDPKKKESAPETPEEKETRLKKEEEEQINKIIERSKQMKQMAYINLKSDVFTIY
jgi:hypothetical protein